MQGIDINPDGYPYKVTTGDFLTLESVPDGVETIVINPPWSKPLVDRVVGHGLALLPDDGAMHCLLKADWVSVKTRRDLLPHLAQIVWAGRELPMMPLGAVDRGMNGKTSTAWFTFTKRKVEGCTMRFIPLDGEQP